MTDEFHSGGPSPFERSEQDRRERAIFAEELSRCLYVRWPEINNSGEIVPGKYTGWVFYAPKTTADPSEDYDRWSIFVTRISDFGNGGIVLPPQIDTDSPVVQKNIAALLAAHLECRGVEDSILVKMEWYQRNFSGPSLHLHPIDDSRREAFEKAHLHDVPFTLTPKTSYFDKLVQEAKTARNALVKATHEKPFLTQADYDALALHHPQWLPWLYPHNPPPLIAADIQIAGAAAPPTIKTPDSDSLYCVKPLSTWVSVALLAERLEQLQANPESDRDFVVTENRARGR